MNKTNTAANPASKLGWLLATIAPGMSQSKLTGAMKRQGWIKMQAGVWMRPCVKSDAQAIHTDALKPHLPCAANVRVMFITDEQWGNSVTLCGPNYPRVESKLAV